MKENEIIESYRKLKRRVLYRIIIAFVLSVVFGILWLFIHSFIFNYIGYSFIFGFAAIAFLSYFWVTKINKEVVCPSCKESLVDVDGDSGYYVFLKKCPYCNVPLK